MVKRAALAAFGVAVLLLTVPMAVGLVEPDRTVEADGVAPALPTEEIVVAAVSLVLVLILTFVISLWVLRRRDRAAGDDREHARPGR